jgi:hypothetical protein
MGNRLSGLDDVVTFVHAPQEDAAEVNGPDAVGDLLEPDRVLLERIGDEEQAVLQADRAGVGDAFDEEMAGVVDRRQGAGIRAGRGSVEGGWRPILERLMGPLIVVEAAEGVEGPLLGDEGGAGRANRIPFQGFVHPFGRAVLLGLGGQDALVLKAQTEPPHVELGEAVDAGRGEGHAVVGADGAGQAILTEQAVEDGAHAWPFVESRP